VRQRYDAIIVGGGHNGLVAATLLARGGQSVAVLERLGTLGGAAVSARPFSGVDARLSRYSYLVSLFPRWLLAQLGAQLELRHRPVSSYTPLGDSGILARHGVTLPLMEGLGDDLFSTLTEPLRSAEHIRGLIGAETFRALAERPLSEVIELADPDDVVRGIIATDALIGTFAPLDDPQLRQNRCFLYHVVGGSWDVPVGGMGALSVALADAATAAGVELHPRTEVTAVDADAPGADVVVRLAGGGEVRAGHVLANVAPRVLAELASGPVLGADSDSEPPEGSQLKLNMILSRLPRLRDTGVDPRLAFAGTFHVNESYSQLQAAYARAARGEIPDPVPCEAYCHSLTDPSILPPALQGGGAVTLTVFALHMPARLFRQREAGGVAIDHETAKRAAVRATLDSLDAVLAEPLEDCLLINPADGRPCLEAHTPIDLERELGMPGGHIFHRDLRWPWAERPEEVGRWGVETTRPNLWICGAGARRGGAVSGIAGHNAARAVLAAPGR
jgi:phytoene dehydrogenase-like protein